MQDKIDTEKQETTSAPSSMEEINGKIIPTNVTKERINNTEDVETEEKLPKLRPRVVRFCESVLSGKTQLESYKLAGYKPKNDNVGNVKACNLLKDGKIHEYMTIRENQERIKLEIQTNVTKLWVLEQLKYSVEYSRENNKVRDLVAATAEINRMQGYNAPVKVDNTISAANSSMDISLLTPEEKLALSNMLKKVYAKPAGSPPAKVIGKIEAAK
jgi:hypothetical protein